MNDIIKHEDVQMMPISQAKDWYQQFVEFSKSILKDGLDFGVIPGVQKPSLYKPGAEKLRFVYGLGVEFETIESNVDRKDPFVDYTYRCTVRSKTGQILSQCEGNCNSLEPKFGYLWKTASELPGVDLSTLISKTTGKKQFEFDFAITKAETSGKYGKPQEYWAKWLAATVDGTAKKVIRKTQKGKEMEGWEMNDEVTVYRVLNPDVIGMKNTIMKMAQKRAFVGAILLATGASEFFTQDVEDMEIGGAIHSETHFTDAEVVEEKKEKQEGKAEKQWLTEDQLKQCLDRIKKGEEGVYDKANAAFKMSKPFRQQLIDATHTQEQLLQG
jgi:hypothetical protein